MLRYSRYFEQVVLIGHSIGGDVIALAKQRMPERVIGLIGVDTFENIKQKYTKEQYKGLMASFQASFAEAMRRLAV